MYEYSKDFIMLRDLTAQAAQAKEPRFFSKKTVISDLYE